MLIILSLNTNTTWGKSEILPHTSRIPLPSTRTPHHGPPLLISLRLLSSVHLLVCSPCPGWSHCHSIRKYFNSIQSSLCFIVPCSLQTWLVEGRLKMLLWSCLPPLPMLKIIPWLPSACGEWESIMANSLNQSGLDTSSSISTQAVLPAPFHTSLIRSPCLPWNSQKEPDSVRPSGLCTHAGSSLVSHTPLTDQLLSIFPNSNQIRPCLFQEAPHLRLLSWARKITPVLLIASRTSSS